MFAFLRCHGPGIVLMTILTTSAGAQAKFDPNARAAMDQMVAAYKGLKVLHEKMSFQIAVTPASNMMDGPPDSIELRFQRPNRLRLTVAETKAGKKAQRQVVCDGATLWRWDSGTNTYTKSKAPATFAGVTNISNDAPEFDILFSGKDPFKDFAPPNTQFTLGKPDKVGEVDVDSVEAQFKDPSGSMNGSMRILIGQKDHLIRGLSVDAAGKDPSGKEMKFSVTMNYTLVNTAPAFTAADFAFTPPPGAKLRTTGGTGAKRK
jgi:outer membrane lipoprotein-sorting protein